jgi:hypothetical protein
VTEAKAESCPSPRDRPEAAHLSSSTSLQKPLVPDMVFMPILTRDELKLRSGGECGQVPGVDHFLTRLVSGQCNVDVTDLQGDQEVR